MSQIFQLTVPAFFISLVIQFIVIKIFQKKDFCIDSGESDKPQKFHYVSTPSVKLGSGLQCCNYIRSLSQLAYEKNWGQRPYLWVAVRCEGLGER
jgi:hypothetical protein